MFANITFIGSAAAREAGIEAIHFQEGAPDRARIHNVEIRDFAVAVSVGAGRSVTATQTAFSDNDTAVAVKKGGQFSGRDIEVD